LAERESIIGANMTEPNNEAARAALVARCTDVVGDKFKVLSQVLSYFPDDAEKFINTQTALVNRNGGKKSVWYSYQKENGVWEQVWDGGGIYTGREIMKDIREIQQLRGEVGGWDEYVGSQETIRYLLEAYESPRKELEKKAKVLEVMEVTGEEIGLLKEFVDAYDAGDEKDREASVLEGQARLMRQDGNNLVKNARERIEERYPRIGVDELVFSVPTQLVEEAGLKSNQMTALTADVIRELDSAGGFGSLEQDSNPGDYESTLHQQGGRNFLAVVHNHRERTEREDVGKDSERTEETSVKLDFSRWPAVKDKEWINQVPDIVRLILEMHVETEKNRTNIKRDEIVNYYAQAGAKLYYAIGEIVNRAS
jgi:hypothetical protein